ncbi:hypothetical protein ANCDUO_03905 [Ancylostoma duodenale]|uniref:Uncharacterized protein n=1 Tax=Ancylostoma duodenale TaxID=51022 RepID=A0A0C2H2J4_9BILA|nr:hypothetical protein ANCDUO_03905 [Ancylostoma duodenale]
MDRPADSFVAARVQPRTSEDITNLLSLNPVRPNTAYPSKKTTIVKYNDWQFETEMAGMQHVVLRAEHNDRTIGHVTPSARAGEPGML